MVFIVLVGDPVFVTELLLVEGVIWFYLSNDWNEMSVVVLENEVCLIPPIKSLS